MRLRHVSERPGLAAINAADGIATMLDTVKKTMLDGNNTERWRLGTLFVWALAYIKASTISERCIRRLHTFSSAERLSRLLLLDVYSLQQMVRGSQSIQEE